MWLSALWTSSPASGPDGDNSMPARTRDEDRRETGVTCMAQSSRSKQNGGNLTGQAHVPQREAANDASTSPKPLVSPEGVTLLHTFSHMNRVMSMDWSLDGKLSASSSNDMAVWLWDATSGVLLHTFAGHRGMVWSVAWSPDGKLLASGSDASRTLIQCSGCFGGLLAHVLSSLPKMLSL